MLPVQTSARHALVNLSEGCNPDVAQLQPALLCKWLKIIGGLQGPVSQIDVNFSEGSILQVPVGQPKVLSLCKANSC